MSTRSTDATVSRRAAVRLGGGGIAAALAARGPAPAAAQDGPAATFVLVHGAWAGAWIWRKVIPLLRDAGADVFATTATGMGDRVHLVYITDVVNLLEYEDLRGVTLVGWSFGGLVITGAAERVPERLAQLVYLDAYVPEDGQNNYDADSPDEETRKEVLAADVAAGAAAGMPGFVPVYPAIEEWIRAMTKDPADFDWLMDKFVPQPLLTSLQPVRLGNPAAALPRAFVFCTEDAWAPAVRLAEQVRSDPNWRVVEVADNHLAPVNAPQATAQALLSLM
jgi:pimeloyl-ACP methyl ester carboxylesterase